MGASEAPTQGDLADREPGELAAPCPPSPLPLISCQSAVGQAKWALEGREPADVTGTGQPLRAERRVERGRFREASGK